MRTLRRKYLSYLPIDEDIYKADFNILDKYQAFSSEILRLALLGLAGFGFLLTNFVFNVINDQKTFVFLNPFGKNKIAFSIGAFALVLAAISALVHRYFSTDCMTHHVRGLRLTSKLEELCRQDSEQNAAVNEKLSRVNKTKIIKLKRQIIGEDQSFEKDLWMCKWSLIASIILLLLGIACVIFGFADTLIEVMINQEQKNIKV